jgi:DNA-binding CsgD family transcriptional regulator
MPTGKDDDRQAILKLMAKESTAFWNKDYQAWADCWVQAPYVCRAGWWSLGGVTIRRGWDDLSDRTRQAIAENPKPNPTATEVRRENVVLRVGKDMAWVTYDQYAPDTGELVFDMPGLSRETKIFEKQQGEWKLVYVSYLHRTVHQMTSAVIQVDQHGRVIWKNAAADNELRNGCGLAIHAGKLRALDRGGDKQLQPAVRWASRLDIGLDARRGALPIVLEGGRGQPANVCWIIADSGMIFVSINDQQLAVQRLEAAAIIYGISNAQGRLAELIIAGEDLRQAAMHLGVSVNTARTHLQRMFEKIGVRSQPALVRALLSVGAPFG